VPLSLQVNLSNNVDRLGLAHVQNYRVKSTVSSIVYRKTWHILANLRRVWNGLRLSGTNVDEVDSIAAVVLPGWVVSASLFHR
jgi:hypothetical protein